MSIVLWAVVALFLASALVTVTTIGKPRKPTTPGVAAFIIFFQMVVVAAILIDRGVIQV